MVTPQAADVNVRIYRHPMPATFGQAAGVLDLGPAA